MSSLLLVKSGMKKLAPYQEDVSFNVVCTLGRDGSSDECVRDIKEIFADFGE